MKLPHDLVTELQAIHTMYSSFNCESKKLETNQALVAQACNPSYSGGREQKDHSLKPAWANSLRDTIWKKKTITNMG
jgi:hypothetical protein